MHLYIHRAGRDHGPYSIESLRQYLAEGSASVHDTVWIGEESSWTTLGALLGRQAPEPSLASPPSDLGENGPSATDAASTSEVDEPLTATEPAVAGDVLPETAPIGPVPAGSAAPTPVSRAEGRSRRRAEWAALARGAARVGGRVAVVGLLIVAAAIGFYYLRDPPPHVERGEGRRFRPAIGYAWRDPDARFSLAVVWIPGMPHERFANVRAATSEGFWDPEPGYRWVNAEAVPGEVVWEPGRRLPSYPHATSGREPATWVFDVGYRMAPAGSASNPWAEWSPGATYPVSFPHVTAAATEGRWIPDPGYELAAEATPRSPVVIWRPGAPDPSHPHVVASATEGKWTTAPGFVFVDAASPTDWRVMRPDRTAALWHEVRRADLTLDAGRCARPPAPWIIIDSIGTARDRYRGLDLTDTHPDLQSHVTRFADLFDTTHQQFTACIAMEEGREVGISLTDVLVGVGCGLLSDDAVECFSSLGGARAVGEVAEAAVCFRIIDDARPPMLRLLEERDSLHDRLHRTYGLTLPEPTEGILCP